MRQMAQLQKENLRLKKLVAELTLDKTMLQDVLSKNGEAFAAWTDGRAVDEQPWNERKTGVQGSVRNRGTYRYRNQSKSRSKTKFSTILSMSFCVRSVHSSPYT